MSAPAPLEILVVEDDADASANVRDILELDGHRVRSAATAAEALSHPALAEFAAIVLDRKLPDATAETLLPALRSAAPGAAIVVVTGFADLHGAIAALRQGAADYILKPIDAGELRARIGRVAEVRRAEEARRAAERRYRILVQNSADIITAFDVHGTVLYQGPSVERVLGRGVEARVGENILDDPIVHPDDLPAKRAFLDDARNRPGETVTATFRLRHADGSYREIEASGTNLLDDPEVGAITASYRDITARKRAEDALRQSEERFRGLVEAAECLIVMLRPDRSIAYLSPFAERLTGRPASEALGRDFLGLFVPEADRPAASLELGRALEGKPTPGFQNAILCRDGTRRWVAWNSRALPDFEGGPALLQVGQDITHLKTAQDRALQAERLAAIGQMVAGLAHESRNALQRAQACLEMLARHARGRAEELDLIDRIQKAQDHLHHLFEDVRGYAAPILLDRRVCDPADSWREAWADLEGPRRGRDARLVEHLGEADRRCLADAFRLKLVFANILDNALASRPGAVEVLVSSEADEVDGRPALRLSFRDDGPGLDPEARRRIFDPFFTTKTKGTGLGMAIARRIVEAHGGRISVGEGDAPGAEVLVTLPRGGP